MVRKTTRRGKRVLVLDFTYTKPDGTQGRYRRDAAVQTTAAAQTEEAARKLGATLHGDPEILCGPNGQPLKPVTQAPEPEAPKEPTFGETVDRYLAEYAPSALAPSTRDDYAKRLKARILPRLGALAVSDAFEVAHSRALDVSMVEDGLMVAGRRNMLLAVRSVAKFAVEAKILTHLPAFLPLPKRGKRVPSAPPAGDVSMVIDAARCPEHRLVIVLAAHGGLRRGEIRALRCRDVELDRDRLIVRLSRYRSHTGTTKLGHEREVPLTPQLRAALLAAGVDTRPGEECAALSPLGRPWGNNGPWRVLQTTLTRLELPRVRLHALRAFFVTTLLNGHVPPHVVMELVGHGDLGTTQLYAAIVPGDRGAAVGVLERAYEGARSTSATPSSAPAAQPSRSARRHRRAPRITGRIRALRRRVALPAGYW